MQRTQVENFCFQKAVLLSEGLPCSRDHALQQRLDVLLRLLDNTQPLFERVHFSEQAELSREHVLFAYIGMYVSFPGRPSDVVFIEATAQMLDKNILLKAKTTGGDQQVIKFGKNVSGAKPIELAYCHGLPTGHVELFPGRLPENRCVSIVHMPPSLEVDIVGGRLRFTGISVGLPRPGALAYVAQRRVFFRPSHVLYLPTAGGHIALVVVEIRTAKAGNSANDGNYENIIVNIRAEMDKIFTELHRYGAKKTHWIWYDPDLFACINDHTIFKRRFLTGFLN